MLQRIGQPPATTPSDAAAAEALKNLNRYICARLVCNWTVLCCAVQLGHAVLCCVVWAVLWSVKLSCAVLCVLRFAVLLVHSLLN